MRIKISDMNNFIETFNTIYSKNTIKAINGISIDSRKIEKNDIFIPLKGKNFDGHSFINKVLKTEGTICFNENNIIKNKRIINTKSNKDAIFKLASLWRKKIKSKVIAITGSNGKTTTKELLFHVLSKKYKCSKSKGNHNSIIGLPLTMLNCNLNDDYTILELGANKKGEIATLSDLVKPDYSIITNISNNHIENFDSFKDLIETKAAIFKKLKKDAIAFINLDDKEISEIKMTNEKVTFGINNSKCDYSASINKNKLKINQRIFNIPEHLSHLINSILSVYAISNTLNIDNNQFQKALNTFKIPRGRGNLIINNNYTIINDAYNASPSSMELGIKRFSSLPAKNKKILIIGDMLELGKQSLAEHIKLGKFINNFKIDIVLTFGSEIKETFSNLNDNYFYKKHFHDISLLKKTFLKLVEENDLVYLKGSRSMKLERIFE